MNELIKSSFKLCRDEYKTYHMEIQLRNHACGHSAMDQKQNAHKGQKLKLWSCGAKRHASMGLTELYVFPFAYENKTSPNFSHSVFKKIQRK